MLLQRYTKNRKLAGHDAYVPQYLDLATADVLVSYLTQCRPSELAIVAARNGPQSTQVRDSSI